MGMDQVYPGKGVGGAGLIALWGTKHICKEGHGS